MARRYAESTSVPVDRSKAELEKLLQAHGANQVGIATDYATRGAIVTFRLADRHVRLRVPEIPKDARKADQLERANWRRVVLICKAKLEIIADGFSSLEREFLSDILLPNGMTVHEALSKQLGDSYRTGKMPPLLPPAGGG
jgi:hypothetical protein